MKKLLTILGAVGLTATTGATVVSCTNKNAVDISTVTTLTALDKTMPAGSTQAVAKAAIVAILSTIKLDGDKTVSDSDYKISFSTKDNVLKENDTITVKGKKNLKGTVTLTVGPAAPSTATILE